MTRHNRRQSAARLLRSLYIWHRWIGLTAALFVILLSVTGLLLNHTEELSLDSRYLTTDWLLDWYGIDAPGEIHGYRIGNNTVMAVGEQLYWNTTRIPGAGTPLHGVVDMAGLVVIGIDGELLLFTPEGELVERLGGAAGVPAGMQALGLTAAGELAIHAAHGYYRTDGNFLEWLETDTLAADWSSPVSPSPAVRDRLRQEWRGTGLSLERVLLDLHSGRILGHGGVYLVDAAALLFMLLAASGIWLWGRRRASAREHRRHRQGSGGR